MKIAQLVPNWSQFHAKDAIGIKAVVRDLSLALIKRGHEVVVFAPDGSTFDGVPVVTCGASLKDRGKNPTDETSLPIKHAYAKAIVSQLSGFDVVHSHLEHVLLPFIPTIAAPVVSTIHGAGFADFEMAQFTKYPDGTFIGLSHRATEVLPYIHFSGVVYNGIDVQSCPYVDVSQESPYLAWMGRFSPNKGVIDAIQASKQSNSVLTIVGFEQQGNDEYMRQAQSMVDGASIRMLDKMIGHVKYAFLGNANAFLFPIHWEEPFGLVMIEAMACGTPVVAYNHGSVPEIVVDGVTGYIIDEEDFNETNTSNKTNKTNLIIQKKGVAGLVEAIARIGEIDRGVCRAHVEKNFTTDRMVEGYEKMYTSVL